LHLLTQSIISAPAAIVVAKILFPNTDESSLDREIEVPKENLGSNLLDAISIGTTDGLKLAVYCIGLSRRCNAV
jgi:CNT family concentrative nucleoside transporter